MPVSPTPDDSYYWEIAEAYKEAELEILGQIRDRLDKGQSLSDQQWQTARLAEIQTMRREATKVLAGVNQSMASKISGAFGNAYKDGELAALKDTAAFMPAQPSAVSSGARRAAVASLARKTNSGLLGVMPNLLRTTEDEYRAVVKSTVARVAAGGVDRRAATSRALKQAFGAGLKVGPDGKMNLPDYVTMAVRTGTANALIQGHLDTLEENGLDLVMIHPGPRACERCDGWANKPLYRKAGKPGVHLFESAVDPVKKVKIDIGGTLNDAKAAGWGHPNCRCGVGVFIPGVSVAMPRPPWDEEGYAAQQTQRRMEREIRNWKTQESLSTGKEQLAARAKVLAWQGALRGLMQKHPELKRQPHREQIKGTTLGPKYTGPTEAPKPPSKPKPPKKPVPEKAIDPEPLVMSPIAEWMSNLLKSFPELPAGPVGKLMNPESTTLVKATALNDLYKNGWLNKTQYNEALDVLDGIKPATPVIPPAKVAAPPVQVVTPEAPKSVPGLTFMQWTMGLAKSGDVKGEGKKLLGQALSEDNWSYVQSAYNLGHITEHQFKAAQATWNNSHPDSPAPKVADTAPPQTPIEKWAAEVAADYPELLGKPEFKQAAMGSYVALDKLVDQGMAKIYVDMYEQAMKKMDYEPGKPVLPTVPKVSPAPPKGSSATSTPPKAPEPLPKYVKAGNWDGKSKPVAPVEPTLPKSNKVLRLDAWLDKVKAKYAAYAKVAKLPKQTLESSNNWNYVQQAINGDVDAIKYLHQNKYLDDDLRNEALEAIKDLSRLDPKVEAAYKSAMAQYGSDLAQFKMDMAKWREDNGITSAAKGFGDAVRHTSDQAGVKWAYANLPSPSAGSVGGKAAKSYSGSSYHSWNAALRGVRAPELPAGTYKNKTKQLDDAMGPMPADVIVHRGTTFHEFLGLGDLLPPPPPTSLIGKAYRNDGYASTSVGTRAAFSSKPVQLEIMVPQGHRAMNVMPVSQFGDAEREVLLSRGTQYYVHDVWQDGYQWRVKVEVVPDGEDPSLWTPEPRSATGR